MLILVACEESQAVTIELRKLGHEAVSCDLLPCSGGHPEWHLQGDVLPLLKLNWDMVIAFPPCTHLASSGARWFKEKQADGRQQEGIDFFMQFTDIPAPRVAIENPVGIMSSKWRKPDQIIHPYQYGDSFQKQTCIWRKGLPELVPTNIVDPGKQLKFASGRSMPEWYAITRDMPPEERAKARSKTFPGIALAMATQWTKEGIDVREITSDGCGSGNCITDCSCEQRNPHLLRIETHREDERTDHEMERR